MNPKKIAIMKLNKIGYFKLSSIGNAIFMKNNAKVPLWLKSIREKGLMLSQFKQLLMIYCARENAVFYDYLKDVLYPLKQDGFSRIPAKSTLNFVENIVKDGKAICHPSLGHFTAPFPAGRFHKGA